MKKNSKKFKDIIKWLNELNDDNREYVLECLAYDRIFELENEELENTKSLINYSMDLFIENEDIDKIKEKLILSGLEESVSIQILDYIEYTGTLINDSKFVQKSEIKQLESIIDFIINKLFLYEEYNLYPFKRFAKMHNFDNTNDAKTIYRFLHQHISYVVSRELSPNTLYKILTKSYDIPNELSELIIKKIKENQDEMEKAYVILKTKEIYSKLEEDDSEEPDSVNK